MKNEKLIRQLFVGKVIELLGEEKTTELLKEAVDAINEIPKTGIELIAEERQRQIEKEGWTHEHDDQHNTGDLAHAAAAYASAELYRRTTSEGYDNTPHIWPFERKWWKPTPENRIRELQKAGALIAAEIDRLQRL